MIDTLIIRQAIIILFISYFVGSIPTAYIVGKLVKGIDIRKYGSGNVGATNVFRVLGKGFGSLTLVIDILKGSFAVFIAQELLPLNGTNETYVSWIYLSAGIFAFLGHIFSIWLKFKGGKGVAVTAGVFLYLTPWEWLIILIVFIVLVSITRYVSLGSILSISLFPIFIYLNIFDEPWFLYKVYFIASIFIAIGVIISHRDNIKRIIAGEENKIFSKKEG